MYCKQCGEQIEDDSIFCRYCGTSQMPPPDPTPPPEADAVPAPVESPPMAGPGWMGWMAGGFVILFLFIALLSSRPKPAVDQNTVIDTVASIDNMAMSDALTNIDATVATAPPMPENWSYSTDEDKVRGATTYYARTTSTNTVRQDSPYDAETTMNILVRQSRSNGTDVLLTISSGQMMCPSYEGCSGTVRFDDGPAQTISFSGPADNSSETIFVNGARGFIAKLKKAKRLIVEKTLYQAGNPQFEFDVSGLKWEH